MAEESEVGGHVMADQTGTLMRPAATMFCLSSIYDMFSVIGKVT